VVSFLLIVFNRQLKLAKVLMALALTSLYLASTHFGSNWIITPLELKYPRHIQSDTRLEYIAVLGCGYSRSTHLPESSKLLSCSQIRTHEALILYQANPGAKVLLTGSSWGNDPSLAQIMKEFAVRIGINSEDIEVLPLPRNTEQEISAVASQVKDSHFALVTSAAHMPRAMRLALKKGLSVHPAPTDFLVRSGERKLYLKDFIPEARNLQKLDNAFHEYYGMLWLSLKEWANAQPN
jgi:uncharacterized SAM-binding protein YcdF (DUF218 family)